MGNRFDVNDFEIKQCALCFDCEKMRTFIHKQKEEYSILWINGRINEK